MKTILSFIICEGKQTKGTYECNMNETRVVTRVLLDLPILNALQEGKSKCTQKWG